MTNIRFEFWSFFVSIKSFKSWPGGQKRRRPWRRERLRGELSKKNHKGSPSRAWKSFGCSKSEREIRKMQNLPDRENTWSKAAGLLFESWNKTLAVSDTPIANRHRQHSINVRFVLKQCERKWQSGNGYLGQKCEKVRVSTDLVRKGKVATE